MSTVSFHILFLLTIFFSFFFFFNDTATTEIYTLSLHDALPISLPGTPCTQALSLRPLRKTFALQRWLKQKFESKSTRSEEHTSELQSRLHLVCRLLLEKKKNIN